MQSIFMKIKFQNPKLNFQRLLFDLNINDCRSIIVQMLKKRLICSNIINLQSNAKYQQLKQKQKLLHIYKEIAHKGIEYIKISHLKFLLYFKPVIIFALVVQHMGKCNSIVLRQEVAKIDGRQNVIQVVVKRAGLLNYIYLCEKYYKDVSWGRYTYWDRQHKSKRIFNQWHAGSKNKQMDQVIKLIEKKVKKAGFNIQGKLNQFIKRKGIKFRDDGKQARMFRQMMGEEKAFLQLKYISQHASQYQRVEFYEVIVKPQIQKTFQQIKELEAKLKCTSSLSYEVKKKLFQDIQNENQYQIKTYSEQLRKKCQQRLKFYQFYLKSHIADDQIEQVLKEFDRGFRVLQQKYRIQQLNTKCWYEI